MSSLSTSFRLLSPKLHPNPNPNPNPKPFQSIHKTLAFSPHRFSHISFQILSHAQHQQSDSDSCSKPLSQDELTSLLPPALREIVSLFQLAGDDSKAKYQQLLHYGSQLPALDPRFKNNDHRVRGCVSQVWVRAFSDPNNPAAVRFEADSDSALTKGLAALLVFGLSGSPASVISSVPPEFVLLLGLRQSLTPSRNNGFLNMLLLMQEKAREVECSGEEFDLDAEEKNLSTNVNGWRPLDYYESVKKFDGSSAEQGDEDERDVALEEKFVGGIDEEVNGDHSRLSGVGTRGERIKKVLERALSPLELDVEDISHLHAGHAGVDGSRIGETHFNVKVVSEEFEGKSMVKRHRLVYDLLQDELKSGLHSLSIVAKTPAEIKGSS